MKWFKRKYARFRDKKNVECETQNGEKAIKSMVCDPGTLAFFKTLTLKILLLFIVDL